MKKISIILGLAGVLCALACAGTEGIPFAVSLLWALLSLGLMGAGYLLTRVRLPKKRARRVSVGRRAKIRAAAGREAELC